MSPPQIPSEVRRWLRYALEDLVAAETVLHDENLAPRHACYLAQQSVEKAIKAVLIFQSIDFPKRHDLNALRNLVPDGWPFKTKYPNLGELTEWVTEGRYPGDWPDAVEADAQRAVRQARDVWQSVCADFRQHGFEVEA